MACKNKPTAEESLTCKTCATPWHVTCLSVRPSSLADTLQWNCPDCSLLSANPVPVSDAGESSSSGGLIAAICAIESDSSLTDRERAERRQQLLCKDAGPSDHKDVTNGDNDLLSILNGHFDMNPAFIHLQCSQHFPMETHLFNVLILKID